MLWTVDGSIGEGGGQILRTAIAVAAIKQKAVRIVNIRKSRPRPGLGVQHVRSIEIAREMTDATVEGLRYGSTEVTFDPGPIKAGNFIVNMGTAGSVTLALQSVLPVAAYAPGPVTLDITGGTDVKWAPPYDYFHDVTLPALDRFGYRIDASLISRGYFPAGNGRVIVHTTPAAFRPADLIEPVGGIIAGVSASSCLPAHVCERQASAASEYLQSRGYETGDIRLDIRNDMSTGSGISLYKGFTGGSALGERGKPAEKVGREAASMLARELQSGAAVDAHLADQLILYMALAPGESGITTSVLSGHSAAGLRIVEQMTGRKFEVKKGNKTTLIRSSGIPAE
ncbi:MAG TPA: RNA 3'-terminal phosphate cyclase [Methanocella sp.]|uniref:RNA 3'-terminal phosphate cyclase n=1 Tax=Methanocella sp. TaxID=2052833 RepID=UPI002B50E338|nr:RNA 3'-terminal phosphate cyclase [Methanocella sp.]HTY91250.1 RNA 3'-terminal phosphate cyclase [Methanocella sp.]